MKITNYDQCSAYDLYARSREMVRSFIADKEAFSDTFEAFGVIVGMVNIQKHRIAELEKQIAEAEDLIATIGDVDYQYNGETYMECKEQEGGGEG